MRPGKFFLRSFARYLLPLSKLDPWFFDTYMGGSGYREQQDRGGGHCEPMVNRRGVKECSNRVHARDTRQNRDLLEYMPCG